MAPTQRAHGEVWHKPDVKAAAEWRRRAAAKLEAESKPRKRSSRASQQRDEVERAAAFYAAHEASIPANVLARTLPRQAAVSAPSAPLARSESLPKRVRAAVAAAVDAAPPRETPAVRDSLWSPPPPKTTTVRPVRRASGRSIADVVPADAFAFHALAFLAPAPRTLLALETELSKAVTAWLVPATECRWRAWAGSGALRPALRGPTPYATAYRTRKEIDETGVVVDLGLRHVRYGLPSWRSPAVLDVAFDALRGTLAVAETPVDAVEDSAPPLPPPPLLRQKLLLEDYRILRDLLGHVADRLYVPLDTLSLVLVRPPLAEAAPLLRAAARAVGGRGSRIRVVEPFDCVAAVAGETLDVVLDLGHFRASALGATDRHGRLGGAALTNYVQLLLRERQVLDGDAGLASSALAEHAKRTDGDHAAVCRRALLAPRDGGGALEQALGEALGKQAPLLDLAAGAVALVGGGADLPGLCDELRNRAKRKTRLADVGDASTAAWRGAAAMSRRR